MSALEHHVSKIGKGRADWVRCTSPGCNRSAKCIELIIGRATGERYCWQCSAATKRLWDAALNGETISC